MKLVTFQRLDELSGKTVATEGASSPYAPPPDKNPPDEWTNPQVDSLKSARLGVVIDGETGSEGGQLEWRVVDLAIAARQQLGEVPRCLRSMQDWLEAGPLGRDAAESAVGFASSQRPSDCVLPQSRVRLLAPLPRPNSIRDCLAFEQHWINAARTIASWRVPMVARLDRWWQRRGGRSWLSPPRVWYDSPIFYKGNPCSVVGHEAAVHWPSLTGKLDYELEFGIVIGRRGRNISRHDAKHFIAGYTIFNDFSARDVQLLEMRGRLGPAKSKDFDTGNALGPWLVTADEVPDPYALKMTARINGAIWSEGTSADMFHPFERMVEYVSLDETLFAGDFLGSGTVPSGCGLELNRWIQPGDVVELEVERLGLLRNRVIVPRLRAESSPC